MGKIPERTRREAIELKFYANFLMNISSEISPLRRFSHDAMACVWEIVFAGEDELYAGQIAQAAFGEIDEIERQLSRFIPSSDVFQINCLKAGERVRAGLATLQCLHLAREIHASTRGAFDITIGALMDENRGRRRDEESAQMTLFDEAQKTVPVGFHLLEFGHDGYVSVKETGVKIDLGAIGKGYALDCVAALLRDWGAKNALLHSGASSVLALGSETCEYSASRLARRAA